MVWSWLKTSSVLGLTNVPASHADDFPAIRGMTGSTIDAQVSIMWILGICLNGYPNNKNKERDFIHFKNFPQQSANLILTQKKILGQ
ncbi:MAG: hypothetical protein R2788_04045 [Saprospiraceae bacterium]